MHATRRLLLGEAAGHDRRTAVQPEQFDDIGTGVLGGKDLAHLAVEIGLIARRTVFDHHLRPASGFENEQVAGKSGQRLALAVIRERNHERTLRPNSLRHVYERAVLREHGIERRHGVALRLGKLVIITLHQFRISFRGRSQRPENYPVFGSCQRLFRRTEPVQQRKPFAFGFRHRQSRRRIGRSEITFVFLLKKIPQIGVMVTVAVPRTARRNTQQVERLKRSRARTVQRRGQSLADDVGTRQVQLHQLFLQ